MIELSLNSRTLDFPIWSYAFTISSFDKFHLNYFHMHVKSLFKGPTQKSVKRLDLSSFEGPNLSLFFVCDCEEWMMLFILYGWIRPLVYFRYL
jgi:hypothetical protein